MFFQQPVGVAIEQLHARPTHEDDEERAGHESADMRPPGDFLVGAGEDVEKLQHDPEADHPFGGELSSVPSATPIATQLFTTFRASTNQPLDRKSVV